MAERSNGRVCGHSLAGIENPNPTGLMDGCLSFVSAVCCQVKVSASGFALNVANTTPV